MESLLFLGAYLKLMLFSEGFCRDGLCTESVDFLASIDLWGSRNAFSSSGYLYSVPGNDDVDWFGRVSVGDWGDQSEEPRSGNSVSMGRPLELWKESLGRGGNVDDFTVAGLASTAGEIL